MKHKDRHEHEHEPESTSEASVDTNDDSDASNFGEANEKSWLEFWRAVGDKAWSIPNAVPRPNIEREWKMARGLMDEVKFPILNTFSLSMKKLFTTLPNKIIRFPTFNPVKWIIGNWMMCIEMFYPFGRVLCV